MATPPRRVILTDLTTALEGITVAGGYKSTVKKVERVRSAKAWEEVQVADRPYIGIIAGDEVYRSEHVGPYYLVDFEITLACYVTASTGDGLSTALNDLLDDIINRVSVDRTRGGVASDTWVTRTRTDEADTESDGCMLVTLQVRYFRTEAKS